MILVIDTSSVPSVMATIDSEAGSDEARFNPRVTPLAMQLPRLVKDVSRLTGVAVAKGPGSFTGLRVGVSFGLGLAIGLGIPIIPLGSLELQAGRSEEAATAVIDAGRGRFYHLVPGGRPSLGGPADIPTSYPLVGEVPTHRALVAAGHGFVPAGDLRPLAEAARRLLETAAEVPYRNLEIEYMQSFSPRKG